MNTSFRYTIINRTILFLTTLIFLFTNVIGWADQCCSSPLAPRLSTQQPDFQKRFSSAGSILSEKAVHAYIRNKIEKSGLKPEIYNFNGEEVSVILIPGLLTDTGQFAHIGLGKEYGRPVIYVDSEVHNYSDDKAAVMAHEMDTINEFETIRMLISGSLGIDELKSSEMKSRIIKYLDTPDPALSGTKYADHAYREIESIVHANAASLNRLYEKYASKINVKEGDIAELLSLYGEDPSDIYYDSLTSQSINIAAGPSARGRDAVPAQDAWTKGGLGADFGDMLEGDAAINDRGEKPGGRSWIETNAPELRGKFIISLSMEGNIPEAGPEADELAGLEYNHPDEAGFLAIGIQPGYSHTLHGDKKVKASYKPLIKAGMLKPVLVGKDALKVCAWGEDPNALTCELGNDPNNPLVRVEVYKINRGGTWSYILMSEVFDVLYPDERLYKGSDIETKMKGRRHRFTQEIVFGKAAFELIKRLDRKPDILHLNEAHTVVAASLMRADKSYDKTAVVYTNHTIVDSGLERFRIGEMNIDVARMTYVLGLPGSEEKKKEFEKFRSIYVKTDREGQVYVDFCHAAFQLADVINAVSDEHAIATKKLFKMMYGDEFNKPVVGVLNGSGESWKSRALREWEREAPPADEEDIWGDKLWDIHEENKSKAFKEIKKRTGVALDPRKPTAWAVRRLVGYKSQYPMLKYLVHLMTADTDVSFTRDQLRDIWFRDITNLKADYDNNNFDTQTIVDTVLNKIFKYGALTTVNGLGMQVVVGWPPPGYETFWAEEFKKWENLPDLKGRFVAVDSDAKFLKMQATAADICINMPRPLDEACGTSDQRTGLNGGVNIALRGAGPVEWIEDYNEATGKGSGFLIGSYVDDIDGRLEADTKKFYREAPADIFDKAKIVSRLFHEAGKKSWKRLTVSSYTDANRAVTAKAMEERYAERVYVPALRARQNTRIISEMALRDYGDEESGLSGLEAVRRELPYMAQIGVKYVYLLGLMKNTGKPFEIMDTKEIDMPAGSSGDLKSFIDTAHEPHNGLKVVMDWIANQHVAKDSEICRTHPERFLYTNVNDGNYGLDRDAKLYRGSEMPTDELKRRIGVGKKLNQKIKEMDASEFIENGVIEIDGRNISYKLGDLGIRDSVSDAKTPYRPILVSDEDALFVVSATDLVSLKKGFPRRWSQLAQPDLSHPDVMQEAIETGKYWLRMGIDGFRIDAATATFPDIIKENWGMDVPTNIIATFVAEMRKIKQDCYFMMEGFERQQELLALAGNKDCAVYSWQCRNYITDALMDYYKATELSSYLRMLEGMPEDARKSLIYLGPEHDAFDYGDPWSNLGYQDRNIMYFIYSFLPGYQLVFNGEIYGSQHKYKNDAAKTSRPSRLEAADPVKREVRERIFSLSSRHEQLSDGQYDYLETDAPYHAMGVARFDDDEIMVGAFNVTPNDGWAAFDIKRIINLQVDPLERESVEYIKESMLLVDGGTKWISLPIEHMNAAHLYEKGFSVNVGPKGCEVIRLRKVKVNGAREISIMEPDQPVRKGSPAKALRALWGTKPEDRMFKNAAVTAEMFAKMRGYSLSTVRTELNILAALGVLNIEKKGNTNFYYLSDQLARAPPEAANKAITDVLTLLETGLHLKDPASIPANEMPKAQSQVSRILESLPADLVEKSSEEDVGRVLSLFSELSNKLDEGRLYEIRYDEERLKSYPNSREILKAYAGLIGRRIGDDNKVKLIPSRGEEGLISVKCFKGDQLIGRGAVGVNNSVDLANTITRITSLVNMAFAEAHIRKDIEYGSMDDSEIRLLGFIKEECKTLTGIDVPEDNLLRFIKDLPKIQALPVNDIEEYNRLTIERLQQSA